MTVMADHSERLRRIIKKTGWLLDALLCARSLDLPDWAVGAGAIRSVVWDHLHGFTEPTPLADVDLVYFDPVDVSEERDAVLLAEAQRRCPDVPWEVTNQAGVHLWYESVFGSPVEPLTSTMDAVGTWPETATSVAVRLEADDRLTVIAPCGLQDLFEVVLRRNPRRVTVERFESRLRQKRIQERWPMVRVVHG